MPNRFLRALALERNDRVPFVPAVYEHKGWFIGKTPSEVARDGPLLVESVLAEYEALRADAVVVGVDVYNVEAEACGCRVTYFSPPDTSIPSLAPGSEVISEERPASTLPAPRVNSAGRMRMMVEATEKARKSLGSEVEVMGALTAPFTLAASLMGGANMYMALAAEPAAARAAIAFAAQVVIGYGSMYAERGLPAALFDSQASPELISPRAYREFVLEPTRSVVAALRGAGMRYVPLVIGGNTDRIVDAYVATGANYILCDAGSSTAAFLPACRRRMCAFRKNIGSPFLVSANQGEIRARAAEEIRCAGGYEGFILGTGIVPYGISTERILAARP